MLGYGSQPRRVETRNGMVERYAAHLNASDATLRACDSLEGPQTEMARRA